MCVCDFVYNPTSYSCSNVEKLVKKLDYNNNNNKAFGINEVFPEKLFNIL